MCPLANTFPSRPPLRCRRLTTEVGKLKGAQPAPTDEKAKGRLAARPCALACARPRGRRHWLTVDPCPRAPLHSAGPVTYELYLSADQAAYERLARAAALEQRIAVLERCVGNENLGPVGAPLPPSSLLPG